LVDDQEIYVRGLKYVLEARTSDMKVVSIALNGREAVEQAKKLRPDIILMDVRMPVMNGVEAAREILEHDSHIKIVMLTTFPDDEYVKSAMEYGAIGYLLKNRPPLEIINAVRGVKDGIVQIDDTVVRALIPRSEKPDLRDDEYERLISSLTRREREVLHYMAQALDNRQIAKRIFVNEQSVRNYISSIYTKLDVSGRMELLRKLNLIAPK
jgi:DNA-binding NarL/FixJ family response regulator